MPPCCSSTFDIVLMSISSVDDPQIVLTITMIRIRIDEISSYCFQCDIILLIQVKCYTLDGYKDGTKSTLRCRQCNISYNYSQFCDKVETGFRFYPEQRSFVEVSDTVFFSRELLEFQCCMREALQRIHNTSPTK